ncbi:hypothetical protein Ga0466249_000207 [Sporomusaceae bacterium BoRhaA]|uniref:hypothetical protein n=1 Tax=Pelorhabdus rhamnosifermentans TaxID=2772457 RepID=UPI001C05F5E1|nr:hypothetical protein [Pelorhabdus rhamnosifermentans]MBU2699128.1 hypothetical protein [Pelorhabdus rhamnosifermentans]
MTEWKQWGTRQKIFAVVLLIILVGTGFYFYSVSGESKTFVSSTAAPARTFPPKQQVGPAEAKVQPLAVRRDPFVVKRGAASVGPPAETTRTVAVGQQPLQGGDTGKTELVAGRAPTAYPSLRLTGIVSAGDAKVGIITYGSVSRSYHRQDHVGPYEIVAIDESSVTLRGPEGQKVLELGKAEP